MLINKPDNVEVNVDNGHKYAVRDIKYGENEISFYIGRFEYLQNG